MTLGIDLYYKGAINKAHTRKHVTAKKNCHNSSGGYMERSQLNLPKISFHCFPKVDSHKRKEWIQKIRRDPGCDFIINERTKVAQSISNQRISVLEIYP